MLCLFFFLLIYSLSKDNFIKQFVDLHSKTGMIALKRSILSPPFIVSANPEVNKYILTNVDNYEKGDFVKSTLFPLLGNGIFNADGEYWLNQRKVLCFVHYIVNFSLSIRVSCLQRGK